MKVTITLGEKALEYVTGIPKEELPTILSDVVERSLAQQIHPVNDDVTIDNSLVKELFSIVTELREFNTNKNTSPTSNYKDNEKIRDVIKKIDVSSLSDNNKNSKDNNILTNGLLNLLK